MTHRPSHCLICKVQNFGWCHTPTFCRPVYIFFYPWTFWIKPFKYNFWCFANPICQSEKCSIRFIKYIRNTYFIVSAIFLNNVYEGRTKNIYRSLPSIIKMFCLKNYLRTRVLKHKGHSIWPISKFYWTNRKRMYLICQK